jgi:hypothetical protein
MASLDPYKAEIMRWGKHRQSMGSIATKFRERYGMYVEPSTIRAQLKEWAKHLEGEQSDAPSED